MLSGKEIIHHKLNGPRELPTYGWKEFSPSNSWLEQKQIQASLEDKEAIISLERIEKQTTLARAEWNHEHNKARVLKKVGKYWEVVGHHQDDEDWLFPEEALYLIEVNVLELYHDGVPVSVEHAYALLLGDSRACTLQEYRVYSYLSRRGYKLIRHAQDVTVTRYEKQINLDKVLESQKRNVPEVFNEPNREITVNNDNTSENTDEQDESKKSSENDTNDLPCNQDSPKSKDCSMRNSDSEDIYLVEDNIEIIEIEDGVKKNSDSESLCEQLIEKSITHLKKEDVIVIDDDSCSEQEKKKGKFVMEPEDLSGQGSDDDVVVIKSVRLESRPWFEPLKKCLVPNEVQLVDLCNENTSEIKIEKDDFNNPSLDLVKNKSVDDILKEMINASRGVSSLKAPNSSLLPKEIVPKHSEYKVNLNVRSETNSNRSSSVVPMRRQYYNNNLHNNYFNSQRNIFGNNVLMQACEMRAMAVTMMQVATSLMTAVNTTQPTSSINQTPIISDNQYQNIYNSMQFQNKYNPVCFDNGGMFNNNSYNNKSFRNQRNNNSNFIPRNRRNYRNRAPWINSSRGNTPNQRKNRGRYKVFNKISIGSEVVNIDSEDDSSSNNQKRKRNVAANVHSKKIKPAQTVEVIDLCEDVSSVKSEPSECEMIIEEKKFNIVEEDNPEFKKLSYNSKSESNDLTEENNHLLKHSQNTASAVNNSEKQKNLKKEKSKSEINSQQPIDEIESTVKEPICSPFRVELEPSESPETTQETDKIEGTSYNTVSQEQEELPNEFEPTSWQEYKEQSEQIGISLSKNEQIEALIIPDQCANIAEVLSNLQIFDSIDEVANEPTKLLKISFDVYLPTDHFKKTVKVLPKFRIIVVNSTDPLPAKYDIDFLKTNYQDGIPFVYAVVYNETITFYFYDSVSLPDYCD